MARMKGWGDRHLDPQPEMNRVGGHDHADQGQGEELTAEIEWCVRKDGEAHGEGRAHRRQNVDSGAAVQFVHPSAVRLRGPGRLANPAAQRERPVS